MATTLTFRRLARALTTTFPLGLNVIAQSSVAGMSEKQPQT